LSGNQPVTGRPARRDRFWRMNMKIDLASKETTNLSNMLGRIASMICFIAGCLAAVFFHDWAQGTFWIVLAIHMLQIKNS
jgi:hypothetical protein